MPSGWFEVAADLHGRAIRNKPFTQYDFPPPPDSVGFSLRMEFARAGEESLDLEAFADRRVWVATCRACRQILEQGDVAIGGQPAKFFIVRQNQPTPLDRYEPHLYWLVRSPFFPDRVVSIVGGPATAEARAQLDRIIATLQFYRPASPIVVPSRTKAEAIAAVAPGSTITRSDARLMLVREFESAYSAVLRANTSGPSAIHLANDPDTLVWVVALAGSINTPVKGGPPGLGGAVANPTPWHWSIAVIPAREPYGWIGPMSGGQETGWPAWFDSLPDRS